MEYSYSLVPNILVILSLVLVVSVIFRYLRLPLVFGYLVVGALIGPHMLGWIKDLDHLRILSGFGVVFLMFTVGLEFSLPKMIALRQQVFVLGGLQVGITMIASLLICANIHLNLITSLIIAGALTMSSTAIVAKQLTDQSEAYDQHGKSAIGILLLQDFAVIPLLILITSLAKHQPDMLGALLWAIVKGVIVILLILSIGQWLFKSIFHVIAATHLVELFTLAALLIVLGTGWLTNTMGLSFALGSFTAGMLLGTTSFRHQIEVEIRPFRDVLLGLFFITTGAILNTSIWRDSWPWVMILLSAIIIGKSLLVTLLCYCVNRNLFSSVRTGLVLAQGGEFGFALLAVAFNEQLIATRDGQIILSALLLSIAIAPIIISHNETIARWLVPKKKHPIPTKHLKQWTQHLNNHIIICGYGNVGQNVASLLEQKKIQYIALDLDPDRVNEASLVGKPVFYGDATQMELLVSAGIHQAKAVVISFEDSHAAKKILEQMQADYPLLPTLVRCRNDLDLAFLKDSGASQLIVESHEASLMLTYCLLLIMDYKSSEASRFIRKVREKHYSLLEQVFIDSYSTETSDSLMYMKQLQSVVLPDNAEAIGRSLEQLHLNDIHVNTIALKRRQEYHHNPRGNIHLRANDVLLLYGAREDLDRAEEILLHPKKARRWLQPS